MDRSFARPSPARPQTDRARDQNLEAATPPTSPGGPRAPRPATVSSGPAPALPDVPSSSPSAPLPGVAPTTVPEASTNVLEPARKGGHGEMSWDEESRQLEGNLRGAREAVFERLKKDHPGLSFQPKLSTDDIQAQYLARGLSPEAVKNLPISGAAPDGGCFFIDGKLALCSEAKKQQDGGNAIERWHKNHSVVRPFGREVAYVTFCSGEGAGEEGVMSKILNPAMHNEDIDRIERGEPAVNKQWNTAYNEGLSCYRNVRGFSQDEMATVLEGILNAKLETARKDEPPTR